jgi:hypothetical protein
MVKNVITNLRICPNALHWFNSVSPYDLSKIMQLQYTEALKQKVHLSTEYLHYISCCFRCFFILDTSAPPFDANLPLYSQQLNKDLVMNVYNDRQWGSYRHLPLDSSATVTTPHAWLNIMAPGDFSSFKWLEGNLDPERYGSALCIQYCPCICTPGS